MRLSVTPEGFNYKFIFILYEMKKKRYIGVSFSIVWENYYAHNIGDHAL